MSIFRVDFAAKIRVRTNVRLLDVEVEADCYCEGKAHHFYYRIYFNEK